MSHKGMPGTRAFMHFGEIEKIVEDAKQLFGVQREDILFGTSLKIPNCCSVYVYMKPGAVEYFYKDQNDDWHWYNLIGKNNKISISI